MTEPNKDTVSPKPDAKVVDLEAMNREQFYRKILQRGDSAAIKHLLAAIRELEDIKSEQVVRITLQKDEIKALESRLQKANEKIEKYRLYCERNNLQGL